MYEPSRLFLDIKTIKFWAEKGRNLALPRGCPINKQNESQLNFNYPYLFGPDSVSCDPMVVFKHCCDMNVRVVSISLNSGQKNSNAQKRTNIEKSGKGKHTESQLEVPEPHQWV